MRGLLGYAGVEDDGYPRGLTQVDMDTSLATLRAMAEEVQAATSLLRKAAGTRKRLCAIVRVHKLCLDDVTYTDLRIAGMSTTVCQLQRPPCTKVCALESISDPHAFIP